MALIVFSWPGVYFRRWHFCLPETGWSLVVKHRAAVDGLWMWIYCQLTRLSGVCEVLASSSRVTRWISYTCDNCDASGDISPWILSICPSLRAAPRTLQRVRTILSALASERNALESRMDFLSPEKHTHTHTHTHTVFRAADTESKLLNKCLYFWNVSTLQAAHH